MLPGPAGMFGRPHRVAIAVKLRCHSLEIAMKKTVVAILLLLTSTAISSHPKRQMDSASPQKFALASTQDLVLIGTKAVAVTYKGRKAVRINEDLDSPSKTGEEVALVKGTDFANGTIEVDVSGTPAAGARADVRGFVGIAFRVQPEIAKFECFYLRPTNGRADDQLRRNHSTQYISDPDYPWQRLRKENPGVYESYVDLEPGVWTKLRIVVDGVRAQLHVNGASQPCLIVNDLKLGETRGQIALWIGLGTEAYFSNLKITPGPASIATPLK